MKKISTLELKNKTVFTILCALWLFALVFVGFKDQSGFCAFLLTSLISVFICMTIRLDSEQESTAMIFVMPVNLIISYLISTIACLVAGDFSRVAWNIGVLLIVGGGSLIALYLVYKKKIKQNMTWDDALLGTQNYTQEVWNKKQEKTYGMARRTAVMIQLFPIFFKQIIVLVVLMLITVCLLHSIETSGTVVCKVDRLVLFEKVILPYLILLFSLMIITGFGGAFAYKRLEITCLHLGHELEGARFMNAYGSHAYSEYILSSSVSDVPVMNAYGLFEGIAAIANAYLCKYGKKPVSTILFRWINIILITVQILAAVVILSYSYI